MRIFNSLKTSFDNSIDVTDTESQFHRMHGVLIDLRTRAASNGNWLYTAAQSKWLDYNLVSTHLLLLKLAVRLD